MRQGYIDSQENKYILTGVKAQLPRWTYAQWQAEGEPDIPWIRTDAPSGYRKVSGDDVNYDNTHSVNEKIDEVNGKKISITELLNQLNIPSTPTSYDCNWIVYDALIIENIFYGNVMASATVPTSYFNSTSSGNNLQLAVPGTTIRTAVVYKNDNTHIYARELNPDSAWGVRIYGIKLA